MMKNWKRVFCVLLVLLLTCGTVLAEDVDTSVLAVVNGKKVDIVDAYQEYKYYSMLYTLYGYGEAELAELKQEIAYAYIQMELIYQQFDVLNLGDQLDMDAIRAEAQAAYEYNARGYQTYVQKEGKTEEQIAAEAIAMLESEGYDLTYFERMLYNQERALAVMEYYKDQVSVTDEDVRSYYDSMLYVDQTNFEKNPAWYEEAVSSGDRVLYTPEGFRSVKHILITLSEENADRMYELEAELEQVENDLALAKAQSSLVALDTEALNAQKTAIQTEMDEIFASIESRAQEVLDKLANGEDFLALMDEYGEDPGMTAEPYKTEGYLVYADSMQWVIPFRDGAMALEKPGDISQPVRTSYGLHIIRYEHDVESGVTPFEDVQEALREELTDERFNAYFDGLVNQWYEDAEIELHLENLDA